MFLPYLTGERTPHPDPLARGAFAGLTVRHTRNHLTRAVLEGVAFGLRDCFELVLESVTAEVSQVRISGGGTRSGVWRQIIADVLGVELVTVNTTEGAAYGAALLAAAGAGAFESVEAACRAVIEVSGSTPPGPDREVYEGLYPVYRELYPALKPVFHRG
jgi:xylulokinase